MGWTLLLPRLFPQMGLYPTHNFYQCSYLVNRSIPFLCDDGSFPLMITFLCHTGVFLYCHYCIGINVCSPLKRNSIIYICRWGEYLNLSVLLSHSAHNSTQYSRCCDLIESWTKEVVETWPSSTDPWLD